MGVEEGAWVCLLEQLVLQLRRLHQPLILQSILERGRHPRSESLHRGQQLDTKLVVRVCQAGQLKDSEDGAVASAERHAPAIQGNDPT